MQEPATFNFHAAEHVPGVLGVSLSAPDGLDLDGSVLRAGCAASGCGCAAALPCSPIDPEGNAEIHFPGLTAGWALYDVYLCLASGVDIPILRGEIKISRRLAPQDPGAGARWDVAVTLPAAETGSVSIVIGQGPKGETGEQGIQGLKGDQGDTGTQGIQGLKGDQGVKGDQGDQGEPGTLTSNAGDVVLGGRLTANGATINGQLHANGGINIPVPPATDTDGVNRLYAAGLSAVMETMRVPLYLSKSKSTLTQGAFTEPGPGLVMSAPVAAKSRQMLSIGLDYTMHAASNYSQGLGWVLPLRSTVYGQLKVSVSYGHGVYTAASSDDMDAYEIYPTDASKLAYGAAMDIYLNQTNIGGNLAAVRTRIIYYDLAVKMMMVRTVTAHVDINNTGLISATSAIVYQQHSDTSGGNPTSDYGSIWLIRNGLASKNIVKIADVPGIHCYNGAKLNSPVLINGKAEDIYANMINVGAPVMQLACGNGRNPAYYGFQALETNAVISSTTAPYESPTNV